MILSPIEGVSLKNEGEGGPLRILNVEPHNYSSLAVDRLRQVGAVRLEELGRDELICALPDVDVLIVRLGFRVDRELLAAGPRLRAVVTATTGLDHIDLEAAQELGIEVLSLQGETEFLDQVFATSEHTWALLLALIRRIPRAHEEASQGAWDRDSLKGRELAGQCLGLVGLGRIGRKVATYGIAFGMRVVAFDPDPERWVDGVGRKESLMALAHESDVLSIHVPLTPETLDLVNASVLAALPEGAVLVNTSRGGVVDEEALLSALKTGRLGGAAVDVIKDEGSAEALKANPLLSFAKTSDRLIVTPHIGGATFESMEKTEIFMAEKLVRFVQGVDEVE